MTDELQPWALGAPCYVCGKPTTAKDHDIRQGKAIHHPCWRKWAEENPHILTSVDKFVLAVERGEITLENLVAKGAAKRVM